MEILDCPFRKKNNDFFIKQHLGIRMYLFRYFLLTDWSSSRVYIELCIMITCLIYPVHMSRVRLSEVALDLVRFLLGKQHFQLEFSEIIFLMILMQ